MLRACGSSRGAYAGWLVGLFMAIAPLVAVAGPVINGDFESATTSGWRVGYRQNPELAGVELAYVAVVGSLSGFAPLNGNYSALLSTVSRYPIGTIGTATCAQDRFNPTYCPPYPPTNVARAPDGGAAVTFAMPSGVPSSNYGMGFLAQDFTATAGTQLAWDWRRDTIADGDFMFAALTNGSHFFTYASRGQDAYLLEGLLLGNGTTQWLQQSFGLPAIPNGVLRSQSFVLPADGLWTMYFGVSHLGDTWFSAAIQLDNVRLLANSVPEPGSLALALLGGASLLLAVRRRRRGAVTRR